MKKLLTALLALVMCICLVNVNNNQAKAQEGGVTEISNAEQLVAFLEKGVNSEEGKLTADIVYETGSTEAIYDVKVRGVKTLDLNGKNITFEECLSLIPSANNGTPKLNIYNGDTTKTSTFKPSEEMLGFALVGTRLYKHNNEMKLIVNIGRTEDENKGYGKIVFNGGGQVGLVGLAVGYHSLLEHEKNYYDNNYQIVNVRGVEFKGFGLNSEELEEGNVGAAIANLGGIVNIENSYIHDNCIGVATGKYFNVADAYTNDIETNIGVMPKEDEITEDNTVIKDNYYGVINGIYLGVDIPEIGIFPAMKIDGVEPGILGISNGPSITGNVIGVSFYREKEPVDSDDYSTFDVSEGAKVVDNTYVDYYCSGKGAYYHIDELPANSVTKFAVDKDYWTGTVGTKKIKVAFVDEDPAINNSYLVSMTDGLYAYFDAVSQFVWLDPFTAITPKEEDGSMEVTTDGEFIASIYEGNAPSQTASFEVSDKDFNPTEAQIEVYDINNHKYLTAITDYSYVATKDSIEVTFNKEFLNELELEEYEVSAKHNYLISISEYDGGAPYPFAVEITVEKNPEPTPEPVVKEGEMEWNEELHGGKGAFVVEVKEKSATQNITAHINNIEAANSDAKVYNVKGASKTVLADGYSIEDSKGANADKYTKVIFTKKFINSLAPGKHTFLLELHDNGVSFEYYVDITIDALPTPGKDESCEKVIGPTWHWNNKKGICEDTGVVKTYTR